MESGKKLATFNVVTRESYRNAKGEKITEIQWHRVVAWGKVAEIAAKYLDKGKEIALEGDSSTAAIMRRMGRKSTSPKCRQASCCCLERPQTFRACGYEH